MLMRSMQAVPGNAAKYQQEQSGFYAGHLPENNGDS